MTLMLGAKLTLLWHFQFQTGLGLIWSIWPCNFNQCSHFKAHFISTSFTAYNSWETSFSPSIFSFLQDLYFSCHFNFQHFNYFKCFNCKFSEVHAHQSSSESETFSSLLETLVTTLHCTTAQCSLVIWLSNNVSTDSDSGAVCRQAALRGRLLQPH